MKKREKAGTWVKQNIVIWVLCLLFVTVYIAKALRPELNDILGTCNMKFMNGQYYRWFTCPFLHYGLYHLFGNMIGLLAVGSLLSPVIGKWRTVFFFSMGAALAEAVFSYVVSSAAPDYGGGASGGIFSLIAVLAVCYLRYPERFGARWYRPDVLMVIVYFVIANNNICSALTHIFGFTFGIILGCLFAISQKLLPERMGKAAQEAAAAV